MSQEFAPRLAMSSFATDGDLKMTLDELGARGIEPADLLLLTKFGNEYRPDTELTNGNGNNRQKPSAAGAETDSGMARKLSLFADELKNQWGRHVLFVTIRDRESEHAICHILLEHAAEPVLIRDMPHVAAQEQALNEK